MLAPYLLQAFARPRQQLIERLPVVQAIVPGVRAAQVCRIHVRAALEVPVVPLAEAVEALDGHRAAGHGPRRVAAARERAGVDGVETHALQRLCQRRGLLFSGVVERDVGPSLQPVLDIPARLAVPRDVETKASARLGVRRHRGEGRHTHPGLVMIHVEEGTLTLDYEGKPTVGYKPGESFFVEAGKVHEGMNKGTTPVKAIATFVVPKGQPITTQVAAATK